MANRLRIFVIYISNFYLFYKKGLYFAAHFDILIVKIGGCAVKSKIYQIDKLNISDHSSYSSNIIVERHTLKEDFRLHWHNYYEIEYFIDGKGKELLNGEQVDIYPGVLHIISPSDFHELIIDSPLTLIKIGFDSSALNFSVFNSSLDILNGKTLLLEGKDKEVFDGLFHTALNQKELYEDSATYPIMIKNLVETIILTTAEYIRKRQGAGGIFESEKINTALAYIHTNFKRRLTLSEVAEKTHFSPSYLSRHFHESVGMTFMQYIKMLRMEFAANLLVNTSTEITDICYEAGFSSPSSFSNEFKRIYGTSPSEYRKSKTNTI